MDSENKQTTQTSHGDGAISIGSGNPTINQIFNKGGLNITIDAAKFLITTYEIMCQDGKKPSIEEVREQYDKFIQILMPAINYSDDRIHHYRKLPNVMKYAVSLPHKKEIDTYIQFDKIKAELENNKLIKISNGKVELTPKGEAIAKELSENRILIASKGAEKIEYKISVNKNGDGISPHLTITHNGNSPIDKIEIPSKNGGITPISIDCYDFPVTTLGGEREILDAIEEEMKIELGEHDYIIERILFNVLEIAWSSEVVDRIVKASQYIIMCKPPYNEPVSFGCGFIVKYRERLFLLTVRHLTWDLKQPGLAWNLNQPNLLPCIELGWPAEEHNGILSTPLFNIGGGNMYYFGMYKNAKGLKGKNISVESFQELERLGFSFKENIDISAWILDEKFKSITSEKPPYEKGFTYGKYKIKEGNRVYIDLDKETDKPDINRKYGLYGRIKPQIKNGIYLYAEHALKLDLSFKELSGEFFLLFNTQEKIKYEEWAGCSGSPIFDDLGKLVAMTLAVNEGEKLVWGLSIEYCKSILDRVIDMAFAGEYASILWDENNKENELDIANKIKNNPQIANKDKFLNDLEISLRGKKISKDISANLKTARNILDIIELIREHLNTH